MGAVRSETAEQGASNSIDLQAMQAVEYQQMDEATKQLIDGVVHSVQLQLKPLQSRLDEVLEELKIHREHSQKLETEVALIKDRISRYENDLNKGLAAIRLKVDQQVERIDSGCADTMDGLEESLRERITAGDNKWAPVLAGVPALVTVLIGLFIYWMQTA